MVISAATVRSASTNLPSSSSLSASGWVVRWPSVWAALATPKETLNDPQVKPNGYTIPNLDDKGVEYQIVAAPVQFDETPPQPARAPEHGQHTEEILLELDLDWDDISAAKGTGAIL